MSRVIGIDIGTSSVKAALVGERLDVLAEANRPIPVSVPHPGWSEQHPDLWVDAVLACLDELAAAHDLSGVAGIGLSAQMLGLVLLDEALRPVRPAILWNDQRALAECADLAALVPDIGHRTNCAPDPGINAAKLLWMRKHEPEALDRARMLMLTKDYVRLALTGELASEPTDAGGTQLFDIPTNRWDEGLCEAVGWRIDWLPPIVQTWGPAGQVRTELARRWGLPPAVPVAAGAGDNMAATLGVGAGAPGDAVVTVGTSGVACIVDGAFHPAPHCAVLTSAHAAPGALLSMGVVMAATASLDWAARLTGTCAADLAAAAETLLAEGRAPDAPVFLPALTGIRTPHGRPDATGRIAGLRLGADAASLGWAVLEGVAFLIAECVAAQRDAGVPFDRLALVGGGTRSALWMRMIATLLGQPAGLSDRAPVAACLGAARLARVAAGQDSAESLAARMPDFPRLVEPDPALAEILAPRRARFRRLMDEALA
ncbi:xylulokinase [Rhodovulum sp. ES.010]|uniref:xylulokinase n=1 Tax=Rhodovulum sp. ES.010 TaxID=1882821 RepID=UPI00092B5CC0|nr:xylulokinase [Rhodovulum sp. ES.010]SIO33447.1 xylulokinase [Rhodovulum sp. ES.010]